MLPALVHLVVTKQSVPFITYFQFHYCYWCCCRDLPPLEDVSESLCFVY